MKIEKTEEGILIKFKDGSFLSEGQIIEHYLMFAILEKLEEIRCCIIDVESAVNPR